LLRRIQEKKAVLVKYRPFTTGEPMDIVIHPYFLKEYHNRWYIFGLEHDPRRLVNLALDRMISLDDSKNHYIPNRVIDPEQYFNDIIGVTYYSGMKKEKVVLQFTRERAPYVITKPIHPSQQIISEDMEGTTLCIEVIPNKELIREILSFGSDVKVLGPEQVAGEVREILKMACENYKE
jgi:predicted DNA-binding transcriptional regulator YafY